MIYQKIISVISKFIIYTDVNELYCSALFIFQKLTDLFILKTVMHMRWTVETRLTEVYVGTHNTSVHNQTSF